MNITLAEQIIGIANEPFINYELIKKNFHKKASEIHPDKFDTEPDKLKATQRFIRLKDAYDFLMNYVSVNGSYKKVISDDSCVNKDALNQSVNQNSFKSTQGAYIEKESWYYYLFILLIPGGYIPTFCVLMFYIIYLDVKKNLDGYIMSILVIILQVLMVIFMFLAGIYLIFKYALKGRIFYQILLTQMVLTLVYHGVCYLYRKYLELKYLRDSALSTIS